MSMLNGVLQGLKLKEARAYDGRIVRGLDWRAPKGWPAQVDITHFNHDFRVLLGDNFSLDEGTFPLLQIPIEDVYVPEIDPDDDRDAAGDGYMEALTKSMSEGWPMPPIVVGNDEGSHGTRWGYPYDGRHRLNAAVRLGLKVVPAIDLTGLVD